MPMDTAGFRIARSPLDLADAALQDVACAAGHLRAVTEQTDDIAALLKLHASASAAWVIFDEAVQGILAKADLVLQREGK